MKVGKRWPRRCSRYAGPLVQRRWPGCEYAAMASVGRLEVAEVAPPPSGWVVGSSPKMSPYWVLSIAALDAPMGRLVLMFRDDQDARDSMGEWIDRTVGQTADTQRSLKHYVERTLRDVVLAEDTRVVEIRGSPELHVWLHEVVTNRSDEMPEELALIDADVMLMPDRPDAPGRLALIRESSLDSRVRLANPRALVWAS